MSDNARLKRTLEFDLHDAPMLVHAMSIAACTAMMCGHPDAEKKLRAYKAMFAAFEPPEAKPFEAEHWAEMGEALLQAKTFHVTIVPRFSERGYSWWSEGYLAVQVQGRTFIANRGVKPEVKRGDDSAPQALYKVLKEIAPMDCEGTWGNGNENEEEKL